MSPINDMVTRLRRGVPAMLFSLAAGLSLLLIMRVDAIHFAPQKPLYGIASVILILAAIGPMVDMLDMPGQILLWNGAGWSAGLAFFGLESVGSLPLWPLMLAALGLTFWPRDAETSLPPVAIAVAFIGGFAVCWLGWSDINLPMPASWLEGL